MSGLMNAIQVGASGLSAQRKRLEVLINNIATASAAAPKGSDDLYRKDVVFSTSGPEGSFDDAFNEASKGVVVSGIMVDKSEEPLKHSEPGNPKADAEGYVYYPNINIMKEMGNVMLATRSYEANLQAVNMAKEMQQKTLELLR
jgi:flagellar basal-body rod protein FlgC